VSNVGHRPGRFGDTDLRYQEQGDSYHCPEDRTLCFLSQSDAPHRRMDHAPAACRICALREQCTTSRRGRPISRTLAEPSLDRFQGYRATEPYAKARRKRTVR
jgi:hypothetical protein